MYALSSAVLILPLLFLSILANAASSPASDLSTNIEEISAPILKKGGAGRLAGSTPVAFGGFVQGIWFSKLGTFTRNGGMSKSSKSSHVIFTSYF